MNYSELVVTGHSGRERTPPHLHSRAWLALTLLKANSKQWQRRRAVEGWSAPPNLLPSQTPAKPSCVSPGYPRGPQLKAGESRGPPWAKRFSISATVTADCCQWEDAVIGPLPGLVLVLDSSSLKNVGLGKRHWLCGGLD